MLSYGEAGDDDPTRARAGARSGRRSGTSNVRLALGKTNCSVRRTTILAIQRADHPPCAATPYIFAVPGRLNHFQGIGDYISQTSPYRAASHAQSQ